MQKRAQETKQKILLAGIDEFALHGYHRAKIDSIAEQAAVNKQRIYAYFNSKQGLFDVVLQSCFERLLQYEGVLLRIEKTQSAELSERILRHYLTFHEQTPQFWRLIAWCNLEQIELEAQVSRLDGPVFVHLAEVYQEGQRLGHFVDSVSFESYIFTLTAISFFYFSNMKTMSHSLNVDLAQSQNRDRIITEILKMLSPAH